MGANFQTRGVNPRVQTLPELRAVYAEMVQDARDYSRQEQLDAGYTGSWDSCYGTLSVSDRVFDTFELAQAHMQDREGPQAVRIRTIKTSVAMARADRMLREAINVLWKHRAGTAEHKAAEREVKNMRKRLDTVTQSAIKRSKTSHYVIGGWCKE